jgi:hypothetical protein
VKVKTLRDDMLIGTTIHPKGSIVEIDDRLARRWLDAKPSPPIAVVVECAALAALAETADLAPKPKRRAAALES